jgi:GTP-binding protein HflX
MVTDTVGFIRKLPHHLVASFRATLEETRDADVLLHVIDASSPTWEEQRTVVSQVLDELRVGDKPTLLVFNKTDLLDHEALLALQERIGTLVPSSIFVSTVTEGGLEPLRRALASAIRVRKPITRILMSPADGKMLAEIHRTGEVLEQRMEGDRLLIEARVDDALAGRLRRSGAEVTTRNGTSALVH